MGLLNQPKLIYIYGEMELELFEGSPTQSEPAHYKCHVELTSELSLRSRRLKVRALEKPVNNPRTYITTRTTEQLTDQVAVILST
jgi:hypothetical protein